jgi:hypothetical protein
VSHGGYLVKWQAHAKRGCQRARFKIVPNRNEVLTMNILTITFVPDSIQKPLGQKKEVARRPD